MHINLSTGGRQKENSTQILLSPAKGEERSSQAGGKLRKTWTKNVEDCGRVPQTKREENILGYLLTQI